VEHADRILAAIACAQHFKPGGGHLFLVLRFEEMRELVELVAAVGGATEIAFAGGAFLGALGGAVLLFQLFKGFRFLAEQEGHSDKDQQQPQPTRKQERAGFAHTFDDECV
jgi:hypothetical protein